MTEAAQFRSLANKCRRLADQIDDRKAKEALNLLATEYDKQADDQRVGSQRGKPPTTVDE